MLYLNSSYLMYMLPALLLMMLTQWYVNSSYKKYSQVAARSGLTGAQAAQRLISSSGLFQVRIETVRGNLTDHYDPRSKTLRLSAGVAQSPSVAALASSAHELGHDIQDAENYFPLRLRAALVPAVNIGSYLGWILIFIGLMLRMTDLAWLGVLVFAGGAVFALATLPVELNASKRARALLADTGLIQGDDEQRGVNNVLNAAALTYVASLLAAFSQLLYYISLVAGAIRRR